MRNKNTSGTQTTRKLQASPEAHKQHRSESIIKKKTLPKHTGNILYEELRAYKTPREHNLSHDHIRPITDLDLKHAVLD